MKGAPKKICAALAACVVAVSVAGCGQSSSSTGAGTGDNSAIAETSRESLTEQKFTEVTFGEYEQDGNTSNGAEDIEWYVLDEQDGKSLLISKYVLDVQPFTTPVEGQPRWTEGSPRPTIDVDWADSALRTWLNGTFADAAFDSNQKSAIKTTTNNDVKNDATHTAATAANSSIHKVGTTQDDVFVLSRSEAWKYFNNSAARVADPTDYAKSQGVYTGVATDAHGQPDASRSGKACWWLRTGGYYAGYQAVVTDDGYIHGDGYRSDGDVHDGYANHGTQTSELGGNFGVRPCIWVDSSAIK